MAGTAHPTELFDELYRVLESSLLEIALRFSSLVQPVVGHSALVIFTEDCTGRPQKKAGNRDITDMVTIAELDVVRLATDSRGGGSWGDVAIVGGTSRPIAAWIAPTGALLVLTDPVLPGGHEEVADAVADACSSVAALWQLVAVTIRHQVASATPAYLVDSRAASLSRAALIAELTDTHATTLESLLAVLRSPKTGDAASRQASIDLAATAMVRLRATTDRDRQLAEEPVANAFERLRDDLSPLARFGGLDLQFVEPPVNGRALPGEIAHAGRAIVRGAVLTLVEQPGVGRVRVQWDCDGNNLLISIRDDGDGDLTVDSASMRQLLVRVKALEGQLRVNATSGWGSEVSVSIPLDAPVVSLDPAAEWGLTLRERTVFELLVSGARNKTIAQTLSISENTAKFHVANVLKKVGVRGRSELAAAAR